jgi:acyl carrier protein
MSEIAQRVKTIVETALGVPAADVVDEATFIDDLGADSLDCMEIVVTCEDEFAITIPDVDADRLVTVGALVAYVEQAMAPPRGV